MPGAPGMIAVIGAFAGLFLGAGAVGAGLAELLAPDSWLAEAVGLFALPVAFAAGLQAWHGLALFGLVLRLLGQRRAAGSRAEWRVQDRPGGLPGSFVFLPISSGAGALAGTIVGAASSSHPWWLALLAFWTAGTVHGLLAWRLADRGVLLPPE